MIMSDKDKKGSDQKVPISIRLPRGVYEAVLAEQRRMQSMTGIEPSLNAVLVTIVERGLLKGG